MSRTVMIGATKWRFCDDGPAGSPALLLLHGFTGSSEFWDDIVDPLKTGFRCIRVDLPGHGRTETSAGAQSCRMDQVARSLVDLLDDIGMEKTHVWGYSMGGRLALHLALMFPERINRLILESASPGINDHNERRRRKDDDNRLADQIEQNGVALFVDEWMKRPLFATQMNLPPERQHRARELRLQHTAAGLASSLRGMGVGTQEPLQSRLRELKSPVLVLVGEYDDKFRAIGMAMAAAIPRAVYCLMPQAGHAPYWEQPEACAKVARSFLLGREITV